MTYNIGSHINIINSLLYSLKLYKLHVVQFFLSKKLKNEDTQKLYKYVKKKNIICVIHAPYIINLARNFDPYSPHISVLINEINYANHMNCIYGVVVHLGKQLDLTLSEAYNNMYISIMYILKQTQNTMIILETPAGQGTELCTKIEDFAYFFNKLKKFDRVKICIDTCHIFASGYDIIDYINKFKKLIGMEYLALIHLNDSKMPQNSHKDRHESIGKGYIGVNKIVEFLKIIENEVSSAGLPIIIETSTGIFDVSKIYSIISKQKYLNKNI